MRLVLLAAISTAIGTAACAPLSPADSYGYSSYTAVEAPPVVAAPYGGYEEGYGGYAPGPYYSQPAYPAPYAAPYVSPGTTIVVGGGGYRGYDRYRDNGYRDQPRYHQPRFDGGYRGNPNLPPNEYPRGRDFGRQPGPQNFGGGGGFRPGPTPVAAGRPGPAPAPPPAAPPPRPAGLSPTAHSPQFDPGNPGAQGGADR